MEWLFTGPLGWRLINIFIGMQAIVAFLGGR